MSILQQKGEHFAPKTERRRPAPQRAPEPPRGKRRPKKKKTKTGTIVFRAIYISLTALTVAAVCAGLFVLWDFLADYERTLPEKTAEAIIQPLREGDYSAVYQSAGFTPNSYEDDSAAREYVAGLFGGEITCAKDVRQSTEEQPVYAVKSGGKTVCRLTMRQTGEKSAWGFPRYEGVCYSGVEVPTCGITITAPNTAKVLINGIPPKESPVSSQPVEECGHFYGYIGDIPELVEYSLDGFTQPPVVTAFREDGSALACESSGGAYRFTLDGGEIPQELSDYAVKAAQTYSKYISADAAFSAVAQYVPEDVPLYENIRTYEARFVTPHSDYDFLDVTVGEYRRYTEDCVSLRVTYTQRIYAGWYGDFDFPTDYTLYLANSGGEWAVTDIIMN